MPDDANLRFYPKWSGTVGPDPAPPDPNEELPRLIDRMLASAAGSLAFLGKLDAKTGAGKRGSYKKHAHHEAVRVVLGEAIEQLTRAQDDLRLARGDEDRFRIACRVAMIAWELGRHNIRELSTSAEYVVLERQALVAQAGKQSTPEQIAKDKAFHDTVAELVQAGTPAANLKPGMLEKPIAEKLAKHLPKGLEMDRHAISRRLIAYKKDRAATLKQPHNTTHPA